MTTQDLEQAIRDIIMEVYNAVYVGSLKVEKLPQGGFEVTMGLDNDWKPLRICVEISNEQKFLKYFREELRSRGLNLAKYYKGIKTEMGQCNEK